MKNLAHKIQQYTKKKGHKIVFKEKLTLSELALAMWEALGYQKIDATVLSRVLTGERLFTPQQLEVFCKLLNLNQYEIYNLRMALYEDYYQKHGLDLELSISPYFLDMVNQQLTQASRVRIAGQPSLTLEWIETLSDQIDAMIQSKPLDSSHPIFALQAQTLLKKVQVYREILLPSVSISFIKPLVKNVFVLAKENHDTQLMGQAYVSLGCAYHIAGQHRQAINHFQQALHGINKAEEVLLTLRHMALSFAYLQQKDTFIVVQDQILKKLRSNNISPMYVSEILEGLARAQGLLNIKEAFDTWDETNKLIQQMKKNGDNVFVRDIQLMRTKLEIINVMEPTEKITLHKNAKLIQQVALDHGYKRHAKLIAKFLSK